VARARARAGQRLVVTRSALPTRARRLHLLHPGNAAFYAEQGVRQLSTHLRPGGVFTLWSNDPPDHDYLAVLRRVFDSVDCEVVRFDNPLQGREATNSVYLAR
jgi:hypothetical protein